MNEYRIRSTGEVKTQNEIKKLHSNISLPRVWDSNVCEALGIDPVLATPQPEVTGYTQAVRNGVIQDAKGNWVQAWTVVDMFSEGYTDDEGIVYTKVEQETNYQARLDAEAAKNAREQRDTLLTECDWIIIKAIDQSAQNTLGIQVPQEWLDYRQNLRDITTQEGFPHNIIWPDKPQKAILQKTFYFAQKEAGRLST